MKCTGKTKAGKPCKANAVKGTSFCKPHAEKTRGPEVKTKKLPDLEVKDAPAGPAKKKKPLTKEEAATKKMQDVLDREEKERAAKKKKKQQGRRFWPEGIKKPTHYVKTQKRPCPKCNRLLTDVGGQAVATKAIVKGVAYLICKVCCHSWKMPIKGN